VIQNTITINTQSIDSQNFAILYINKLPYGELSLMCYWSLCL